MKKYLYLLITIIFLNSLSIKALEYGKRNEELLKDNLLHIRKEANINSESIRQLEKGDPQFEILGENKGHGCDKPWYQIKYFSQVMQKNYEGYVCSTFVVKITNTNQNITENTSNDNDFINYLNKEGFPTSYHENLIKLHKKYPGWIFKAFKTKDNWKTSLKEETYHRRSLHPIGNDDTNGWCKSDNSVSYYYNWHTDTYVRLMGPSWAQAADEAVAYYLDPRNHLDEKSIFMFEKLDFDNNIDYNKIINSITNHPNTYVSKFNNIIIEAGRKNNISPAYLASLIIKETGFNPIIQTSGNHKFLVDGNYVSGYYNFLNIGAYDTGNAAENGLRYAYRKGWNSPDKAITEGAAFINNGYINKGQNTKYLIKFNVSPKAHSLGLGYYHQYMTDITSPKNTAITTYNSYKKNNNINNNFIFEIPVFDDMPLSNPVPNPKNPNNYLKNITINDKPLENFKGEITDYNFEAGNLNTINIKADKVHKLSTVSGEGVKKLTKEYEVFNIDVKAYNGSIRTYTIKVHKKKEEVIPKPNQPQHNISYIIKNNYIYNLNINYSKSDFLKQNNKAIIESDIINTGTKITIDNTHYKAVIFGDINGDGYQDIVDLLMIKKYILKNLNLQDDKFKASDLNKDNLIDIVDLLIMKKHILKTYTIKQY